MKIVLDITGKEIAALVTALQERHRGNDYYEPTDIIQKAVRSAICDIVEAKQGSWSQKSS